MSCRRLGLELFVLFWDVVVLEQLSVGAVADGLRLPTIFGAG